MPERIEALAPTRIDLAGGTLDIWPLYLLHDDPLTVNAAIDLTARARVESVPDAGIEIISRDRGGSMRAASLRELAGRIDEAPAELAFVVRLVAHFLRQRPSGGDAPPRHGCRVTTDCRAPAGSGLGGSSTLGIALAAALDRFTGRRLDAERLLYVTRAIETQTLGIPTGEQDYHPALRGGLLALHYTVEGTRVERLRADLREMQQRTVLVYTGVSRSSGISNWDMFKRHLDGDRAVRNSLERVIHAARAMRSAILSQEWDAVGAALAEEWEARKGLSPTVTNAAIDRLIEEGRGAGALAGKVCGAGGGGCVVLWVREGRREAVRDRLAELGASVLEADYAERGVEVTES